MAIDRRGGITQVPDSQVIVQMRQWKAALLQGEQAQMREMATRWLGVEQRLHSQMDALALQMVNTHRDGGTVSQGTLFQEERYQELLSQLTDELDRYSEYANRTISDRQRQLARLGIRQAAQAITTQGVRAGFARLPIEAVENLVGLSGNGSPLRNLLVASWPLSADAITQELINGVALGLNPRQVARNMARGMERSLDRMMVIARTEQLRVYRETNRQSYIASGVVTSYKRLATHDGSVCAACLMDESTEYELNEEMPEHPQGRCALVPMVAGVKQPTWKAGADWFVEQPDATQRAILGKGRFEAWQRGAFGLDELVSVKINAIWGDSLAVMPLRELV